MSHDDGRGNPECGRRRRTPLTSSDYQLALKYYLRATEMQTPPTGKPDGQRTRAWWGVKMVRLLS